MFLGFPCGSAGKESPCNMGDLGSIPGLGRSPGEGLGYPFQYSWASLVAQLVKNSPVIWEIWVWSLGWEDPLEKGKATHCSILAWKSPWGGKESNTTEWLSLSLFRGYLHSLSQSLFFHLQSQTLSSYFCLWPLTFSIITSSLTLMPLPPSYNYSYDYFELARH